jgi:hypothetical protein
VSRAISAFGLCQALKAEGFELPQECADVTLEMPVDGAMQIVYHCFLTPEDIVKLGKAFERMGNEEGK